MGALIKRKDADSLAAGLKVLGWNPTVGTISYDERIRGYQVGVIVGIGDERLQWAAHDRNPLADFFSIANIAAGETKNRALKPVGFNWSVAGPDSVHLSPSKEESTAKFVERLRAITPPQKGLFDDFVPEAKSAHERAAPRP